MMTMATGKDAKMAARIGEDYYIGQIRNGYLFLGHHAGFKATNFKPEVASYASESTSIDIKTVAVLKGERHYKAGQTDRIWVYILGEDTAMVETCPIGESFGPAPFLTDRATARRMWANLK